MTTTCASEPSAMVALLVAKQPLDNASKSSSMTKDVDRPVGGRCTVQFARFIDCIIGVAYNNIRVGRWARVRMLSEQHSEVISIALAKDGLLLVQQ